LGDWLAVKSLEGASLHPRQKAEQKEDIDVLGVIVPVLRDADLLDRESITGRGWIVCMFFVL
jgi:hypothetical protein